MQTIDLETEITKAVNSDPTANRSVQQFWKDTKLTFGIRAAVAHPYGVATLAPDGKGKGVIEGLPLSWGDLDAEWAEWNSDA